MKNCPKCKADLRLYAAEGADVEPVREEVVPEPIVPEEPVAEEAAPVAEVAAPEAAEPAAPAEAPAAAPPMAVTAPAPAPTGAPFESEKARVPMTKTSPVESPEEHYAKEIAFQQDLANRHIEPKTYASMFAKKDTLGKIGTIFGMLLAGAGSGLTGQPNVLLDMMNKEIDRDLDAQKTSKANANTFLKTQYDHDLQQSQMLHNTFQNAKAVQEIQTLKDVHAGEGQANRAINKRKVEAAGGTWDDSLEKAAAETGFDLGAKNKMLSTVAQHLDDISANNPQAKQMVQTVIRPVIDTEIKANVVKATKLKTDAVKIKEAQKAKEQESNDVVDMDQYHKMLDRGVFNKQHNIPMNSKKDIDPADDAKIQEAVTRKTAEQNNYKDIMEAYQAIASMPKAGETQIGHLAQSLKKIPWIGDSLYAGVELGQGAVQRPRDQLLDALSQRLSARGASAETMEMMKKALSPTMFDTKDTLAKGAELVYQHFNHKEDAHPGVLKKYGLDKDLKKIDFNPLAAQKQREGVPFEAPKEGKSATDKFKDALRKNTGSVGNE